MTGIGTAPITRKGSICWAVLDIEGKEVFIEDDDCYYSKQAPYRLLCPHSWRDCMNNQRFQIGETQGEGATMIMNPDNNDGYLLSWN